MHIDPFVSRKIAGKAAGGQKI